MPKHPAGRQVQLRRKMVNPMLPAGRAKGGALRRPAHCLQSELRLAHLHPLGPVLAQPGNQLRHAVNGNPPQRQPRLRRQPPAAVELARELVGDGGARAVKVQPDLPRQRQPVGAGAGIPPVELLQPQLGARIQQIGRPRLPALGQVQLAGVQRLHASGLQPAQRRRRGQTPDLLRWPVGAGLLHGQACRVAKQPGSQPQPPVSGAHLHP